MTSRSLAPTPWTRSLKRTVMLVKTLVTFAKKAGMTDTMYGASVFVGGIVMMILETTDVPCRPFAPKATACSALLPNGASHMML